jgi:hypothetical protein
MLDLNSRDVEFVNLLKVFEKDVSKIHWKLLTTEYYPVSDHLEKIFTMYVNIYKMSDAEIENMLNFVSRHTNNDQVRKLILYKLIWKLRRSEEYSHQSVGQTLLNKHIFDIR